MISEICHHQPPPHSILSPLHSIGLPFCTTLLLNVEFVKCFSASLVSRKILLMEVSGHVFLVAL